jgi:hypothetical protein
MRFTVAACLTMLACSKPAMTTGGGVDMSVSSFVLDDNPAKLADIGLTSYIFTGATSFQSTFIGVSLSTYSGAGGPCSHRAVGACTLHRCPRTDMGGGAMTGPPRTPTSAGTLTLTGLGTMPIDLPVGATQSPVAWNGGETLSVQATGGMVPAFNISVVAPAHTKVLTPQRPAMGNLTVDRSKGFTVTWMPVPSGTMQLFIGGDLPDAFVSLVCETPATSGTYTFAPDALSSLGTSTSIGTGAQVLSRGSMTAGDWPITMEAGAPVDNSTGDQTWGVALSWQ